MNSTEQDTGVGHRVARARKLANLTQRQLADRAHVGLGTVRHVEQGRIPASPSFVAAVALALQVTPAHLYDTRDEVLEQPGVDAAAIAELRAALDAYDDPRPEGEPLSAVSIASQLAAVADALHAEHYTEAAPNLPPLLHHLYPLADVHGHDGETARALLHDAYRMAANVAGQFRQYDLAALASERHIQLAPHTGDQLRITVSAWHRSTRYLQHGDFRAGLRLLDRAREYLDSTPYGRAMAVQLNLRSAVLTARNGDLAGADDWTAEAQAIVDEFAPPGRPYFNTDASPLNVTVHHVALPVETYDGGETVRRAERATVADRTRPERVAHHHIDVARAHLLNGDRATALDHLQTARQIAPRRTRQHPQVTETVRAMALQERRRDGSLAGFARWAGIRI